MKPLYYVTQTNSITEMTYLLGYNLNEIEKDKLFYSLGKDKNSAISEHLSNAYGCHNYKFGSQHEAERELLTKPRKFNDALKYFKTLGYDVVKKGIVNKKVKVISYQQENKKHFGL